MIINIKLVLEGSHIHPFQWAFKLYDKDGGGEIDLSEMVEAVGTLHAMSAVEVEEDMAGREAIQMR